jgi:hypothetical protein
MLRRDRTEVIPGLQTKFDSELRATSLALEIGTPSPDGETIEERPLQPGTVYFTPSENDTTLSTSTGEY